MYTYLNKVTKINNEWQITVNFLCALREMAGQGYSIERIAGVISIPPKTLYSLSSRNKQMVRDVLEWGRLERKVAKMPYDYCSQCDDYYKNIDDLMCIYIYGKCTQCLNL